MSKGDSRAVALLRERLATASREQEYREIASARDEVLARFQPLFRPERVGSITAEEFRAFLPYSANKHWRALQRLGPQPTQDIGALREALARLLDESLPLAERVDFANKRVARFAQAVITPILLIAHPERYGVWNRVSQTALEELELWPELSSKASLGERYAAVNRVLLGLAKELGIDLWTLDALWWFQTNASMPALQPEMHAWIEVTSDKGDHGGPGWELGRCVWSPARNDAGHARYESLKKAKVGDVVVHFVETNGARRVLGWSSVVGPFEEREEEPPTAGAWAGRGRYYRVPLGGMHAFAEPPLVSDLEARAESVILGDVARKEENYPYGPYAAGFRLVAGAYFSRCTPALYEAIRRMVSDESPRGFADVCNAFSAALRTAGITYGERHDAWVRTFLCSAAAKRFVILTGLSGSGKTQIALKLGEWFGAGRLRVVPVRPDWTGPDAIVGYEDALVPPLPDGRRAWHVPKTLDFVMRAAADPSAPYVLVLDEMNLAHVERYFADFLSAMESRQPVLPKLERVDGVWRVDGDRLMPLPDNLVVIGTVNVDETTYMFSPKVLDRAHTLEFRVETGDLAMSPTAPRPRPCDTASPDLAQAFLDIARDGDWHVTRPPPNAPRFIQLVRVLHAMLSESGDEFGHRTVFEGVRLAALLAEAGESSVEGALDAFVLQKVLPRLHGSRRRIEPILVRLNAFCARLEDVGVARESETTDAVESPALPGAYRKSRRMLRSLRANQFASFSD